MKPVALQDYICSLDPASLPRILKICSGVYFQSYFSSTVNPQLYSTLDKLMSAATQNGALPIYFSSVHDIKVQGRVVPRDQPLMLKSVETYQGIRRACCMMDSGTPKFTMYLPLSLRGTFYSWGSGFPQTLLQTLQGPVLLDRPFICPTLHWNSLILQPVYEIDAIMHMRTDIVKIPSTLEVDVEDITASSEHLHQQFSKPLLLSDILAQGGPFPMRVAILEVPDGPPVFHRSLKKGQELMIHGPASPPWRVLASSRSRKTPRHFLISGAYRGKLRRRPHEFHTAFDLLLALSPGFPLYVVATQDWEGEEGDSTSPSLFRGDRLEVLGKDEGPNGEVLVCNRLSDVAGEEEEEEQREEKEQLLLPLYSSCGFVEEMSDGKRYSLANLITQIPLPCEVKVLGKDPSLSEDPLASLLGLRLEEKITEPFLTISLSTDPKMCFEIPPRWLDLTVVVVSESLEKQGEPLLTCTVEELTDAFYYKLQSLQYCSAQAPPPRPPKTKRKCNSSAKPNEAPKPETKAPVKVPELPAKHTRACFLPQASKSCSEVYGKSSKVRKPLRKSPEKRESDDSDHDYEDPDEELKQTIKMMAETILPYCDHDYEYVGDFS
ncbi:protein THEMIS2 isoform X2 [Phascolarctos cinereus]|uniref:Protein THEMIS2 isoform X2 n=1 Tax=Phascolarctos cinereus TaxID=38626 RepID=A0A6P5K1E7_PHACI|nr:protein THEMIS2 isoform X2 [Phascolarctos cinereus]